MAKEATIGQMRSRIIIKEIAPGMDGAGYPAPEWKSIFPSPAWCLWVNAHGRELTDILMRAELREVATITMRYSPKINVRCRIWREGAPENDAHAFEILSIDNVEDRRNLVEIKVKRLVVG